MKLFALFAVLVLLVPLPREPRSSGARDLPAIILALLSAGALPWSGAPVLHFAGVGSWAWFPLFAASIFFSPGDGAETAVSRLTLVACLTASVAAMSRLIYSVGVPGGLFSVEGLSMILRLEGLAGARLWTAMALLFAGLALSFAEVRQSGVSGRFTAFSFAGFLSVVFAPFDSSRFFGVAPPGSIILDTAFAFATALLARDLIMRAASARVFRPARASRHILLPAVFTAAGCLLLAASP
ncbi:MAG: hypothetical protein LBQ19_06350 [Synergistaceae bacterium]|nr:hypothetical protein [Synergistaceae bacterium]